MKFLKYLTFLFLLPFTACVDEDLKGGRIPDIQEAVNMRIVVDPNFSSINADDPGAAKVVLDLYSENIEDVEKVDLYIDFFDFSEGTRTDRVFVKTVPVGSFSDGVLNDFEISFEEFRSALGFEAGDFNGLDQVTIYNVTTMKDGRVYPSDIEFEDGSTFSNVNPQITNSTATTSFTTSIPIFVQCPLPAGFATGTYIIEQVSGPDDPFFGNPYRFGPGEVTITEAGPIQRTFTAKYLTFDVPFNFVVTCGTLVVPETDTGLSCGGPSFTWAQDGSNTYTDDAVFDITLIDNITGACGVTPSEPLVLKLTKK